MKKRFFYLEDIDTVETVETITKKELLSIAEGLKSFTFSEHDDVISGYTKDGKFFYYNCTNFWTFKKSDIINAISVVYSSDSGYYVYGDYTVNMYGVVNPTEDGETLIWTGGNIKEVESADYSETEETAEEPAEVQAEEPAEEKPAENPNDSAFITEMVEALKYFKRVLWSYIDGTRYERDISGDFWGAHECGVILSFVNNRLKAQGAEPYYKLKNDFDSLTECFEEIMQKFEYGDERTIEEIIAEYNFT